MSTVLARGKDVAILAYIPRFPSLLTVPQCGWHDYLDTLRPFQRKRLRFGFGALFREGNHRPPNDLGGGERGFENILNMREYRGAAMLTSIELIGDDQGKPIDLKYRVLRGDSVAGFTPVTIKIRGGVPPKRMRKYMSGHGDVIGPEVELDDLGATLRYGTWFQIGFIGQIASVLFTSRLGCKAWVGLKYRINADGTSSLTLTGSEVPSQAICSDWNARVDYRMTDINLNGVAGFLGAGYNNLGPMRPTVVLVP